MQERTMHMYENLRLSINDGVAIVTLNRPKALNALNTELVGELGECFKELDSISAISAVVLTGAGNRAFAAGADIAEMKDLSPAKATHFAEIGQQIFLAIERFRAPVIAAVNGYALGGGCELAMACDIILASESAAFGQPEVTLGVIPGFGGTQRLARLVGRQRARELCYTGRIVKAPEAERLGICVRVVEGDVVEAAVSLAKGIARNGPRAVALAKRAINIGADLDLGSASALEAQLFGLCFATQDQTEGMGAFLEKRKPTFTGN